jgi:hypothetical protein
MQVNKTLNTYFINIRVYCNVTPNTSANKKPGSEKQVFNLSGEMKASVSFEFNVRIYVYGYKSIPPSTSEDSN